MKKLIEIIFRPHPDLDRLDTSLRYKDILFGFVMKELFIRLATWFQIDVEVRFHLIVGTILVLGSWIGYRQSLNRPRYQVKFVNLPLLRFILDQAMLVLYFYIATLTPALQNNGMKGEFYNGDLAKDTILPIIFIFVLYMFWDALGMRMAATRRKDGTGLPLYPVVKNLEDMEKNVEAQRINWEGLLITIIF